MDERFVKPASVATSNGTTIPSLEVVRAARGVTSSQLDTASASTEFLRELLQLARATEAERADEEGRLDEHILPDPNLGALTRQVIQAGASLRRWWQRPSRRR